MSWCSLHSSMQQQLEKDKIKAHFSYKSKHQIAINPYGQRRPHKQRPRRPRPQRQIAIRQYSSVCNYNELFANENSAKVRFGYGNVVGLQTASVCSTSRDFLFTYPPSIYVVATDRQAATVPYDLTYDLTVTPSHGLFLCNKSPVSQVFYWIFHYIFRVLDRFYATF